MGEPIIDQCVVGVYLLIISDVIYTKHYSYSWTNCSVT